MMADGAAQQRLAEIALEHGGRLSAPVVVEDAASESSPLHSYFEWDDTKAAHEHRLYQARTLIRSVTIEVSEDDRTVKTVRYVRDPGSHEGYIETVKMRDDTERARDALAIELVRLTGLLWRARSLAEALGLGDELSALEAAAGALVLKVEGMEAA